MKKKIEEAIFNFYLAPGYQLANLKNGLGHTRIRKNQREKGRERNGLIIVQAFFIK